LIVGSLTVHRIRADFDREVSASATEFAGLLRIEVTAADTLRVQPNLDQYAASAHAVIRILYPAGNVLEATRHAPDLGLANEAEVDGYRVHTNVVPLGPPTGGALLIQYARPLSELQDTIARVELLLVLGTLAGTALALLAGATIARRAMAPIARLTSTAAEIARTRDPSAVMPEPEADDEVAELARTLQGMLGSLDEAHAETEAMLRRQRRFVADASHEMRTPLTSVLATSSCWPNPSAATRARPRAPRCAPPCGCAGSSPTCCCSPAPTCRARSPTRPWIFRVSPSTPPPSWAR